MTEKKTTRQKAIEQAILRAGSKAALMQKLNERGFEIKSVNVVSQWIENGVPAKYCPDIEDLTGVPCERLCPEVRWGLVRDRRKTGK
jgi:DNA-binding transcriptional regulator YdaS (Cro superfamily)